MKIEYSQNNSGGRWWLRDEDWYALEAAGWEVEWFAKETGELATMRADGRWLGALASRAFKDFETPGDAMREFEKITKADVSDQGCNCCGEPHCFTWEKGYAAGQSCLPYLFPDREIPGSLREALENQEEEF